LWNTKYSHRQLNRTLWSRTGTGASPAPFQTRITQHYLHSNAVGNLWAISYSLRPSLALDAAFDHGLTTTSTHWEEFIGFTYFACRIGSGQNSVPTTRATNEATSE
jgi:hypothetical protein